MENEEKEVEKASIRDRFIGLLKNSYSTLSIVVLVLLGISLFQPVSLRYIIWMFFLNVVVFVLGKDLITEDERVWAVRLFKGSILLVVYSLLANVIRLMSSFNTGGKSLKPLGFMMGVGATIFVIFMFIDEDKKEVMDEFIQTPFAEKVGFIDEIDTIEAGDIIVCNNKQTGKPVIIPHKDRYVHKLVLGPTGSGKTSQILIPSILQDIKTEGHGITIIEPKGDLAEKVDAMGKIYDREVIYFNPTYPDCPYFNPLYGPESEVIENITTVYKMLGESANPFFENKAEILTRNAIMVVKRLKGNKATLLDFSTLIHNPNGMGYKMVKQFQSVRPETVEIAKQNDEIASWFLDEYFNEKTKEFEFGSGLRSQVAKTVSNEHLRRVLNPPGGVNDLNFDEILEEGKVLAVSTAQGELRELSSYLGYFIILNYQSAVFRRPGTEDTRRPHFLYIDEFQTYSNPAFSDMLTQGRSYRVGCILATQARDQMAMGGGSDGEKFVKLVSTNARNVVLFPGISASDSQYYSEELGEIEEVQVTKSTSQPKFSLFEPGGSGSESISERKEKVPRYSPSEIRYKPFKEITYSLMKDNELQYPGDGVVDFIPWDLHVKINEMVEEYREMQLEKAKELKEKKIINNIIEEPAKDPLSTNNEDDGKKYVEGDHEYRDNFIKTSSPGEDDLI